ncbi:hypothetical protein C1I95_28145 [Micromonospora craterilacus]|uniref:Uncharacterized protein n=1 Tax=Micromonospora craterilacus TaxID=1655439 RepID=A0A2W2DYY3_9ACTN|nr:hypothetical protein [Micromonospora craterilacus]PZG10295.1 hypothetical protein C1I95_28145 [Micromonospora craterilacus]
MTPDHDKPTNPRWPNPLDEPLHRARAAGRMYRQLLRTARPDLCQQADDTLSSFGETWMLERPEVIEPDREVTTAEAAALANVTPLKIRKWASTDRKDQPGVRILPRFDKRGRETVYLAGHVLEAASLVKRGLV